MKIAGIYPIKSKDTKKMKRELTITMKEAINAIKIKTTENPWMVTSLIGFTLKMKVKVKFSIPNYSSMASNNRAQTSMNTKNQ